MDRMPKGFRAVLAALALVGGTVGLAYAAGGDLPDQASDKAAEAQAADRGDDAEAERKAGSTGPADGEGSSSSADVQEVIEDRDGGGCEFGQAVAEAARGDEANEEAGADDPCEGNDGGEQNEDKAAREAEREERKAARTHEPQGGRETGEERSNDGGRKAGSTDPVDDDGDDVDDEDDEDDDDEPKENQAGGKSDEAREDHGPDEDDE